MSLGKYAKGVAAAATGAVNVGLLGLLDAIAQADTWVTAVALVVANFIGTVAVVKLDNTKEALEKFAEGHNEL